MFKEYRRQDLNNPEGWELTLKSTGFFWLKVFFDPRFKMIKKNLSGPILDVGCGRGDWVKFLSSAGYKTSGLDYSRAMIDSCIAANDQSEFICADLRAMPFDSESFNAIISWGVIEHDENGPTAALREFYRVLSRGGKILVTVPVDSIWQRRSSQISFGKNLENSNFFQYFFTQDELCNFCRLSGFEVKQWGYLSRPHPALVFPRLYNMNNKFLNRILQALSLLARAEKANMIYCLAQKV